MFASAYEGGITLFWQLCSQEGLEISIAANGNAETKQAIRRDQWFGGFLYMICLVWGRRKWSAERPIPGVSKTDTCRQNSEAFVALLEWDFAFSHWFPKECVSKCAEALVMRLCHVSVQVYSQKSKLQAMKSWLLHIFNRTCETIIPKNVKQSYFQYLFCIISHWGLVMRKRMGPLSNAVLNLEPGSRRWTYDAFANCITRVVLVVENSK